MKFTLAFLLPAATIAGQNVPADNVQHRGLQLAVEDDWKITGYDFKYDTGLKKFTGSFTHGGGMGLARLSAFAPGAFGMTFACPSEYHASNPPPDEYPFPPEPPIPPVDPIPPIILDPMTFTPDSTATPPTVHKFEFGLDNGIKQSPAFSDVGSVTTIHMCLRFALQDSTQGLSTVDVSFKEIEVKIDVDLSAGIIDVVEFYTQAVDPTAETEAIGNFFATAVPCSGALPPYTFFNDVAISYCICPKDSVNPMPTTAESIYALAATGETGSSGPFTQHLIVNGAKASAAVQTDCSATAAMTGCCQVSFWLNAQYFPYSSPAPAVTVELSGVAILDLKLIRNRRLGHGRAMAIMEAQPEPEYVEAPFEGVLEIQPDPKQPSASGAERSPLAVAAMVGAAAGAILII